MKKKVLLIDDSMTIHRVVDLSVDEEKYEVEKVFSAEDAQGKLKSFKPDIVLLDNKLEGIKLNEYVSRLKSETNSSVILLVGAFDHFNESNLSATNADDFIVKPFNSSLLEEKLEKFGQKAAADVKDTDIKLKPLAGKDSAVEELLASIDSEESVGKETQFDDFDDLFTENTSSVKSVSVEDENKNLEIEESLEMSESTEKKEELDEPFDLEGIFDDVKIEEKMEEDLLDTVLTEEEQNKDLVAAESDSDILLSDLLEEDSEKEDEEVKVISEEATAYKEEYSELSDIFGELEVVSDEEEKSLMDEAVANDNEVAADSLKEIIKDEEAPEEEFEESFETVSEIDDNIGKNIGAEEIADKLTEDIHDNIEFGADIKEKVMLKEVTEAPIEEEVLAENSVKHVQEERLLVDREMIKKTIEDALDLDFLRGVVREVISRNLEKVIWEIVPDMAEKLIVEEIERLKKGDIPNE